MPGLEEEEKAALAIRAADGEASSAAHCDESEGLPADVDLSRGVVERRLPNADRLLLITRGDEPLEEAGQGPADPGFDAVTTRLRPMRDTWAQRRPVPASSTMASPAV